MNKIIKYTFIFYKYEKNVKKIQKRVVKVKIVC